MRTPWSLPKRLEKTLYAITNHRAFVIGGQGYCRDGVFPLADPKAHTFNIDAIRQRRLKRRSRRRTDIVFGQEVRRGHRGRRFTVDIGFLGLREWWQVESALASAFDVESAMSPQTS